MGYDISIENPRGKVLPALERKRALHEVYMAERERAVAGVFTEDCAAGSCSSCGVCSGEVRVDVAGERR